MNEECSVGTLIFTIAILLVFTAIAIGLIWDASNSNNYTGDCDIVELGYVGRQIQERDSQIIEIPEHYYVTIENRWGYQKKIWIEQEEFEGLKVGEIWHGSN